MPNDYNENLLVKEIQDVGYNINSVWDLVNNTPHAFLERNFLGSYQKAYLVLAKHLDVDHDPKIMEGIIRALGEKDLPEDIQEKLLQKFYGEKDTHLKWILANTLKIAIPLKKRKEHPTIKETLGF